jgi:putative Mg2+ transporter-C (MgtC) family protein
MDLMRLPLGILTGVGFIGGGAILRKGDLITGVTTAATLWLMTVIGLCLGGGQLLLGTAATILAVLTLRTLKRVEGVIPREHHARLIVTCEANRGIVERLPKMLKPLKYDACFQEQQCYADSDLADYTFELSWRRPDRSPPPLDLLHELNKNYQVRCFEVTPDH